MKLYLKIIAFSSLFVIIQAIVSMNTTLLNTSCNNADDSIFLEEFGKYFIYLSLLNIVLFKLFDLLRINKNFPDFFEKILGWKILLATFNSKWEKVGESGRK